MGKDEGVLQKRNGKDKDKYHNICYVNNCHHNADKPKGKTISDKRQIKGD